MYITPPFLIHLLHICEFIALVAGIFKLRSLKNSYWKWFVYYLIYIFFYEILSYTLKNNFNIDIAEYMSFIIIPVEFIFLFWLYAYKSLQKKLLFWAFSFLFIVSLIWEDTLINTNFSFQSLNNTIGTLMLLILVGLEFLRQIKSDSIINFKNDKMFYINFGVILFYIGNMPFFGWYQIILQSPNIWNNYNIYFLVSNSIMYLLFAASFIWGKTK
jgi:hypothetical protein